MQKAELKHKPVGDGAFDVPKGASLRKKATRKSVGTGGLASARSRNGSCIINAIHYRSAALLPRRSVQRHRTKQCFILRITSRAVEAPAPTGPLRHLRCHLSQRRGSSRANRDSPLQSCTLPHIFCTITTLHISTQKEQEGHRSLLLLFAFYFLISSRNSPILSRASLM